jgi:hypothetical protein
VVLSSIILSALLNLSYFGCIFSPVSGSNLFLLKRRISLISHVARDTARTDFKVGATFTVILPTLAYIKSMSFIHKNIQLYSTVY